MLASLGVRRDKEHGSAGFCKLQRSMPTLNEEPRPLVRRASSHTARRRGALGHALFVGFVVLVFQAAACKRSPAPSLEATRPAPVPAPAGLVAEIIVARPDRTWDTVRAKLRAATSLVPSSPAVFLGGALGLPLGVLEQLDFNVPIVGAVVEDGGVLAALGAIHVKDGQRVVQLMTSSTPRYTKEAKPGEETVHLVPSVADPEGPSFAVSGNYLVVGRGKELLERWAPFVTRTLPARPLPIEDIAATATQGALAGPVATRLARLWLSWKKDREADDAAMRAKHGGSAPDFGDPAEALADMDARAARFFAILGDFEEARFAVTVHPSEPEAPERYRAIAHLKARSAGPAADELALMTVAPLDPLLALPASAGIAFLTRDSREVRERSAVAQAEAMAKVFGGRLAANDKTKIETALRAFAKGRGDWLTGALVAGPTRAAVVRGSVAEAAEIDQSAFALLDLLSVRAIAEPISNWIGDMKISGVEGARAAGETEIRAVRVARRPPKVKLPRDKSDKNEKPERPGDSDTFDIVWAIGKEVFVGAAGRDAKQTLASLEKPEDGATLARIVHLKSAAARFGPTVAFALFVDPARLGAAPSGPAADSTLLFTYGKAPGPEARAFVELEAPSALVMSYAGAVSTLLGSSH
jgi:hypothetical protein